MGKINLRTQGVNWKRGGQVLQGFLDTLREKVKRQVEQEINQALEDEASEYLGRGHHERRDEMNHRQTQATCPRCGSRHQRDFSRNGYRSRQLVTLWGILHVWLPRVKCQCGGSVRLDFGLLRPYQRFWDDVVMRIGQWAEHALSLRQMQTELNDSLQTSVGLRKLNECLQAIKQPLAVPLTSVPPVLMLDAIWVTVLRPTGEYKKDKRGRVRAVKQKHKVAVLVALGVWPQSGRWVVLDWELADEENYEGWEVLLVRLETRGVYSERGLQLIIHDGGKGLVAAINRIYPYVPHQRCVFHKLRNIWQVIVIPEDMSRKQARQLRQGIIREAAAIYQADSLQQTLALRDAFRERWQATQPQVVATLERDWHDTITFHRILRRFPRWLPSSLRTTSVLERVNRMLRRMFRAANAYHSDIGLRATVARVLMPFRAV
jgi:transposase-like protein